jgi:2-polyprenyl-3-methyl-5-hydroxy-6-metoxy-1,4-benzoquinol methylase
LNKKSTNFSQNLEDKLLSVEGKTIFGISIYRATDELKLGTLEMLERWGKTIKQTLKQSVQSVRYVESREPILSSVSVDKNGLVKRGREFLVYEEKDGSFSVAKTMAVQPFEELGARDFGRPGRDDTSGMLPPKLALMLINLTGATTNQTLLDPFCGSGTVITEAMVLGFQSIIGSDISEKAVSDTKKNVKENYKHLDGEHLLNATIQENVLVQIENLKTHPAVAALLARGDLKIHAWVYKFETGQVFTFSPQEGRFDGVGIVHDYAWQPSTPDSPGESISSSYPAIDWIIVGGESGPESRPMQLEWAQSIAEQCKNADVPFFMKQLGGHPDKRHNLEQFPVDLRVRQFPG